MPGTCNFHDMTDKTDNDWWLMREDNIVPSWNYSDNEYHFDDADR